MTGFTLFAFLEVTIKTNNYRDGFWLFEKWQIRWPAGPE